MKTKDTSFIRQKNHCFFKKVINQIIILNNKDTKTM